MHARGRQCAWVRWGDGEEAISPTEISAAGNLERWAAIAGHARARSRRRNRFDARATAAEAPAPVERQQPTGRSMRPVLRGAGAEYALRRSLPASTAIVPGCRAGDGTDIEGRHDEAASHALVLDGWAQARGEPAGKPRARHWPADADGTQYEGVLALLSGQQHRRRGRSPLPAVDGISPRCLPTCPGRGRCTAVAARSPRRADLRCRPYGRRNAVRTGAPDAAGGGRCPWRARRRRALIRRHRAGLGLPWTDCGRCARFIRQ